MTEDQKLLREFVSLFSTANHGWDFPALIRLRERAIARLDEISK